jgi:hypothetical protein
VASELVAVILTKGAGELDSKQSKEEIIEVYGKLFK